MSAYLDAELGDAARARMERHTAECPNCRGVLGSLNRMLGLLHRLPAPAAELGTPDVAAAVLRRLRAPADL